MPRGRPKKNPVQVSAGDIEDSADTSATATGSPAPKRRGRPPKNPVPLEEDDADNEDVQDPLLNETEAPTPAPRKRGRPRKNPVQPRNEETDNEIAQNSPAQEPEAPTPVVRRGRGRPKKVDTPGLASSVTKSPAPGYVKTGRPRGRPPTIPKAVSFSAPTPAQGSATPTGRGRGRPPKNAGTSSAAATPPVIQEPPAPFDLQSLVGSYIVRSPAIEEEFLPEPVADEDNGDAAFRGTLKITKDMDDDDMLYGKFNFGDISGSMALTSSWDGLQNWVHKVQSGEEERVRSDMTGYDDDTEKQDPKGKGKGKGKGKAKAQDADENDEDDSEENMDISDIKHELDGAIAGMKRKEAPVKRGPGRPPKKQKRLPKAPPRDIVYFVYSYEISDERYEAEQDRRYGTIEPDDSECQSVHGVFPNFPVIDKSAIFHAKKVETVADDEEEEEAEESSEESVED